ncbi:MAG: aminopeptidase P family protein [Hyphomonadaceae bacterium]|nr:aminopeptidase P family protein [Hyphomonadaceae bacterium]
MPNRPPPIGAAERAERLAALRRNMEDIGVKAVLLGSTTSLKYFTGVSWHASERFCGAIVHANRLEYVAPRFELEKVSSIIGVPGEVLTWEEDENPYRLIADRLPTGRVALDDQIALFMYLRLRGEMGDDRLIDGGPLINTLRRQKSASELALMQHAKDITLEVHRRAWKQLHEGQRASEVQRFIDEQHRAFGGNGTTFCIVSFGEDTSLPHGGEADRALAPGAVVLIDTGTQIDGYNSDITRTYVFGEPTTDVRKVWDAEKEAQAAAFDAAILGAPCEAADYAARVVLERHGFGPDYRLPGLPHRTGHGIGLDVHEAPNLCRGDITPLAPGMCFSNEPMVVVPGRFGVRHEDHFYMTDKGPRWFTQPAASIDDPFANAPAFA